MEVAPRIEVKMGETTLLEQEVNPTGYQNLSDNVATVTASGGAAYFRLTE